MSPRSELSDLELAALRASLGAAGGQPAGAVGDDHIGFVFTREGAAVRCGDNIPEAIATEVAETMAAAGTSTDVANRTVLEVVCAAVRPWRPEMQVEGGPMFVFDRLPTVPPPAGVHLVASTDEADAATLEAARPMNWQEDEWRGLVAGDIGPWVMALRDGEVVAYCHTPEGRITSEGAECGVWTHPRHRGQNLAGVTTAAWARVVAAPGRHLFYGTDASNTASQRVADKLGLRLFAWGWTIVVGQWPEGDAWGRALADHRIGRWVPPPELETDGGEVSPAMHPAWFFRDFDEWDWWERELLSLIADGPVVDLGAGAGRNSLWLQSKGIDVTAIESSLLAAQVCRQRGVRDVRVGDLNDPPADRKWAAILLLCGNLGLGGSAEGTRRLLTRLGEVAAPRALLVGDTVDPGGPGGIRLRIRYRGQATPWWPQYNIPVAEIPSLVEGTGWNIERHLVDLPDHAVLLRKV